MTNIEALPPILRRLYDYLIEHAGEWRDSETISDAVFDVCDPYLVRAHIYRLRDRGIAIENKHGFGYRLTERVQPCAACGGTGVVAK